MARVLVVAGSDSGGGAGIQGDIKTITVLGAYAATALTALTVQNTLRVRAIHVLPVGFVAAQMRAVLEDIGAEVIKIGMVGSRAVIAEICEVLLAYPDIPVVLDPVMRAKGGAPLIDDDAAAALCADLVPLAAVLTPNAPEAAALVGFPVSDVASQYRAAQALLAMGAGAALVKGGHVRGTILRDCWLDSQGDAIFEGQTIDSRHTHGTGCAMASAIAAFMALGIAPRAAAERAHAFVRHAILAAPGLGAGHGPLGHNAAAKAMRGLSQ